MYDVITVGSSTVDVFADTLSELIKIKTSEKEEELIAYPAGSKILIKNLTFMTGGGGTNSAVGLARLGHRVGYLGKIGNDDRSEIILKELRNEKVDFLGAKGKEGSGYSIILDSLEHDRTILTYKGVNDNLSFKEVKPKRLKTKWFYFSSMVSESYNTLERLAEFAERNKIKILFNPSSYLAEKGLHYLRKILEKCDILVLNKEEAGMIIGEDTIENMMKELHVFSSMVVVTNGKEGAHAYDGKKYYSIKAHKVSVVEATGAGDAFASAFLSGIIRKKDVPFALRMGLANAESVLTHRGAKVGLLKWGTLKAAMRKSPVKVEVKNG